MSGARVIAVVVTYNRKEMLRGCLDALLAQTRALDEIVVVENASADGTREMLAADYADTITRIEMAHNVGGAGGFHRGMVWAHEAGADFVWLMDDDGVPAADALERLLDPALTATYGILNALVVDRADAARLSFGFRLESGQIETLEGLEQATAGRALIEGHINPFNGTLIGRTTIERIGFPRPEMFIWGDEEEYTWRALSRGVRFATVKAARHRHPASRRRHVAVPLIGTLYIAPPHAIAVHARNMGYIARRMRGRAFSLAKLGAYLAYFTLRGAFGTAALFGRYWRDGTSDRYRLPPSREDLVRNGAVFEVVPRKVPR